MLKSVLIFFFCCSQLLLSAQYLPIIEDNKYWIFQEYFSPDDPNLTGAYFLTISGDTMVNSIQYQKVYKYNLAGTHPCQFPPCFEVNIPYEIDDGQLYQLIREDVMSKKIYHLPLGGNWCAEEEYEALNFDLQESEELTTCLREIIGGNATNDYGQVDSITTAFIYGQERRTLNTTGWVTIVGLGVEGNLRIAEGIGFEIFGIFHRENNLAELIDVCQGDLADCNIISSISSKIPSESIKIFPNPTAEFIFVASEKSIAYVEVFDIQGKRLQLLSDKKIDLSPWPEGIYFLKVKIRDQGIVVKRVIKTR